MRMLALASIGAAIVGLSDPAAAQKVRRSIQEGPQPAPAFWAHDDGTIEVNGAEGRLTFSGWDEYLSSDYFSRNGRKCGLPPAGQRLVGEPLDLPFDGVAGGSSADCSCNRTNFSEIYDADNGPTYRIPVVVHVIQNSSGSQGFISEACVIDQIETLNEDFNAIPGSLGQSGYECKIEFFLAEVDPQGNPTNGITYSQNTTWFNDGGNYFNSLAWPTKRYLNIYTNTASGALGYVPALGCSNIDGSSQDRVVILYQAFGNCATIGSYNRGRTCTHEVGHYFGLEHTFAGGCASSSGCSQNGDLICDTNPQNSPTSVCSNSSSCGQPHDNQTNYMDYSVDNCLRGFTRQQQLRMRCIIEHYRVELPCDDCVGTNPPANDECADAIDVGLGVTEGTTVDATTSGPDSPLTCSTSAGPTMNNDVWYRWTAPANGFFTMGLCGATFDSRLTIWNSAVCPTASTPVAACSDDQCGDDPFVSNTLILEGQTVLIQIGSSADEVGTFSLDVDFTEITNPPANDSCSSAQVVTEGTTSFDNFDATDSGFGDPLSCASTTGPDVFADVWFEWTATCTGFTTISTCGTEFDSRISIFNDSCPTGTETTLACSDSGCGDDASVSFLALAGQKLIIRVGSQDDDDEGSGTISIACVPLADPCPEDFNDDGFVDAGDLGPLLAAWATSNSTFDLNDDGTVNAADLGSLLGKWGPC